MTRLLPVALRRFVMSMVLFACGLGVLRAAAAASERDGKVSLAVNSCPDAFDSTLRRILRIELGDLLDERGTAETLGRERIEIECEADVARVSAHGADDGPIVRNDLRFDTFPADAVPRAAALAALEALRAVDPTLSERLAQRASARSDESRSVPPSAPSAPPRKAFRAPLAAQQSPRSVTRIALGPAVRFFLAQPRTSTLGMRLELSARIGAPWDAGLDIEGAFVRRRVQLGTVESRMLSTAGWLGARAGAQAWSATAGLGVRLGVAQLEGDPRVLQSRGHQVTRPWGGPMLVVRTDGSVSAFALALILEAGLAVQGAEGLADGTPVIALHGSWVAACAGLGVQY